MTAGGVRVGVAVVEDGRGRYLVGTRGPDGPLPGLAEFPGGKCEPAEPPARCAERECREETGLSVRAHAHLLDVDHEYPHGRVSIAFWLCRPLDEALVAEDHGGYHWVPAATLASLPFPAANAAIITRLTSAALAE